MPPKLNSSRGPFLDPNQTKPMAPTDQSSTIFGSIRRAFSYLKSHSGTSTPIISSGTSTPLPYLSSNFLDPTVSSPLDLDAILNSAFDQSEALKFRPTNSTKRPELPLGWRTSSSAVNLEPENGVTGLLPSNFHRTASSASKAPSLVTTASFDSSDASIYSDPPSGPSSPRVKVKAPTSPIGSIISIPKTWSPSVTPITFSAGPSSPISSTKPRPSRPSIFSSTVRRVDSAASSRPRVSFSIDEYRNNSSQFLKSVDAPAPLRITRTETLNRHSYGRRNPPPPPPMDTLAFDRMLISRYEDRPVIPAKSTLRAASVKRTRSSVFVENISTKVASEESEEVDEDEARDKVTALLSTKLKIRPQDDELTLSTSTKSTLATIDHASVRNSDLPPTIRRKLNRQNSASRIGGRENTPRSSVDYSHPSNRFFDLDSLTGKPAPPVECQSTRDLSVRLSQVIGVPNSCSSSLRSGASSIRTVSGDWTPSDKQC